MGIFDNLVNQVSTAFKGNLQNNKSVRPVSAYEQLQTRVIYNPGINLKAGEVCFYRQPATAYHQKNVVTGSKSKGTSVNVRVAKGVSIKAGGGGSTTIRENVGEYYNGTLYVTNMRMILLAPKHGFDVMIPKITSLSPNRDGIQLFVGSKCHSVITRDVNGILGLLNLMNQAFVEQPIEQPKLKTINTKKSADELRELKKLLDEGIISQQEFDAKKRQILGL